LVVAVAAVVVVHLYGCTSCLLYIDLLCVSGVYAQLIISCPTEPSGGWGVLLLCPVPSF
jgi:hypothetical protein